MQKIQPRSLSDEELIRYYALQLDSDEPIPKEWAVELLRRFNRLLVQRNGHPTDKLNPLNASNP